MTRVPSLPLPFVPVATVQFSSVAQSCLTLSNPMNRSMNPCPQSFPASGSFQMSQLFASGDQSIGVSASISLLSSVQFSRSVMSDSL